jgi:hypothetical protein
MSRYFVASLEKEINSSSRFLSSGEREREIYILVVVVL